MPTCRPASESCAYGIHTLVYLVQLRNHILMAKCKASLLYNILSINSLPIVQHLWHDVRTAHDTTWCLAQVV